MLIKLCLECFVLNRHICSDCILLISIEQQKQISPLDLQKKYDPTRSIG